VKVEISSRLIDVITADLGTPLRRSNRSAWLCPFHEDKNPSLKLWPDDDHFKCFGCGKYGDAINWVKERKGISFREAVSILNGTITESDFPSRTDRVPSRPLPKKPKSPEGDWSPRAGLVVAQCVRGLESRGAESVRQWLLARGMRRATLERWKIGQNPKSQYLHGHYVYEGVTIPWLDDDLTISIKIRRFSGEEKYTSVTGSRPAGVYLHQDIRPAVPTILFEGEFDALLAWQEVRDLINVGTLGAAGILPDQKALIQLLRSPLIFLSYDNDPAGERALKSWQEITERIRVVRLPHGKDLTEFFEGGGDVRSWVSEQLRCHTHNLTRHPTVVENVT